MRTTCQLGELAGNDVRLCTQLFGRQRLHMLVPHRLHFVEEPLNLDSVITVLIFPLVVSLFNFCWGELGWMKSE